jgi:hypothetical protein
MEQPIQLLQAEGVELMAKVLICIPRGGVDKSLAYPMKPFIHKPLRWILRFDTSN